VQAKPYLRTVSLKPDPTRNSAEYPFSIPALRGFQKLDFHPDVTFIIGENGTGKSTLLEAIAIAWGFNAEGGSRNFNFSTRASHSELCKHLRLTKSYARPRDGFFLRAESYFNVATAIEGLDRDGGGMGKPLIDAYGGRSLHEQSHGESFFALAMDRFRGKGLYVLDEPEAALSPMRQLALLRRIHHLVARRSQFIISTHSPILIAYPSAKIILLSESGMEETRFEETEHFIVMREFVSDPKAALEQLLAEA
jgi:predicted ATPase